MNHANRQDVVIKINDLQNCHQLLINCYKQQLNSNIQEHSPMFSNQLLNKILKVEEQCQPTPQFNRYNSDQTSLDKLQNRQSSQARAIVENDSLQRNLGFSKKDSSQINLSSKQEIDQNNMPNLHNNAQSNQQISGQNLQNNEQDQPQRQIDVGQFTRLKNQMLNIQNMAIKQMNRLKDEIQQKDEQIGRLLDVITILRQKYEQSDMNADNGQNGNSQQAKIKIECEIQTESDLKDEQIKILKEAVVRHIRINKQLTKKLVHSSHEENNMNSNNLTASIQKIVSKIQI